MSLLARRLSWRSLTPLSWVAILVCLSLPVLLTARAQSAAWQTPPPQTPRPQTARPQARAPLTASPLRGPQPLAPQAPAPQPPAPQPTAMPPTGPPSTAAATPVTLRNVAAVAGVSFVLAHHPTPEKHLIESVPGGVAAFDYNGDGRVDLFFTNGATSPALEKRDEKDWNRLYRNDGGLRFTDVTRETGLAGRGYAMGVAAADYDNDGDVDLFVAGVHQQQLFRNNGPGAGPASRRQPARAAGAAAASETAVTRRRPPTSPKAGPQTAGPQAGFQTEQAVQSTGSAAGPDSSGVTFEDVTSAAGLVQGEWAVGGGWFDYDRDGHLDLFVVNYLQWSAAFDRFCGDSSRQIRVYCHPRYLQGLPNRLYRNRGDGTFEDVSARAGIARHVGKGMSVAFADVDADGFLDAFVTNDGVPNFLFRNRGDGTFEEVALLAGVAVPSHGRAISSMGADAQDYDNDGRPDVHLTALAGETFPLYRNQGGGAFVEATQASRLATLSAKLSGWSTLFVDLNNDGWKDLFTANAHVNDRIEAFEASAYKQANSIFLNEGGQRFRDASAEAGPDFRLAAVHHGAAAADLNDDGRVDVVVSALGAPAEVWENTTSRVGSAPGLAGRSVIGTVTGTVAGSVAGTAAGTAAGSTASSAAAPATAPTTGHWIILKLVGTRSNRDGIGARITIGTQTRLVSTSAGYVSSSDVRAHFGLGAATTIDRVTIAWPSGTTQVLEHVAADRVLVVTEGR